MQADPSPSAGIDAIVLQGGGELGGRMRAIDWAQTPLGPVERWPRSLKTAVRILLTSRQPMFVWWGKELVNLYNDAYKAIVGGKHPKALGQPASEVWREIWDQVAPRVESAMRANEGTYDESLLLIMERNGYPEETYYTFSYSPVPDDDGGTGGIICANTDDTQRIVGERQLALLRELAARTADARSFDAACTLSASCLESDPRDLPFAMIYLLEPDRRRVHLAAAAGIACGHAAAPEWIDLDAPSRWPIAEALKTHAPVVVSDLGSAFGALPAGAWPRPPDRAVAVPIAASGATGRAGVLVAGLNPFRLFDDAYRRFVELVAAQIAASVAHAHAYEEEKRRAEALAELDRAKTAFFSNVSHELRTPLTLLLGPIEAAMRAASTPGETQADLELAHRNGLRLLKLVNTLLDFSRIEAGRVEMVFEPTDLAVYTAELASNFRSAVERAGMALVVDCPPLPEPVYADRQMWEKIVLNLLSNAFKHTFEGSIHVSLRAAGAAVELVVRDTGTGIPADALPRLFERFYRVQGARARTHEGSGIGLALVHELVELHGGAIAVESAMGVGTTFTVSIPLGRDHLPSDRVGVTRTLASTAIGAAAFSEEALRWMPDADRANAPAPGTGDGGGRIVLADDNADMRAYVSGLLAPRYRVEAVPDGAEALAAIRREPPDLVLTDVMMPTMDGFALLAALREDPTTRAVPVVMISARAGEEARVEGIDAGADDYLVKPFSARELLSRVGAQVGMARFRAEALRRERALRDEAQTVEERYRTLLHALPVAVYTCDLDGRVTMFNQSAVELWGREPDSAPGMWGGAVGIFTPSGDRLPRDASPMVQAMREGRARRAEVILERADRSLRHVLTHPQPVHDASGAVTGTINVVVDITDQKRTEAELAATRNHLAVQVETLTRLHDLAIRLADTADLPKALTAVLSTLVEAHGAQHGILSLYDAAGDALEQAASVGFDADALAVLGGIRPGPTAGACGSAFASRRRAVVEDTETDPRFEALRAEARRIGIRAVHSTPIPTRSGELLGVLSVHFDAPRTPTDQEMQLADLCARHAADAIEAVRAHQALRESEERFRQMADDAPMMVWVADADAACTFLSRSWRDFTGQAAAAPGASWIDAVHPDERASVREAFVAACARRAPFRVECRVRHRDGGHRWTMIAAAPRRAPRGAFLGFVGSAIDISERKEAEDALIEADRRKDEFLATLAHELRNPLAPLSYGLHVMGLPSARPESIEHVRGMMERQVQQMVRLVDDLLDVSRISRGTIELRKEQVDVAAVVMSALETSRPLIQSAGHELTVNMPPEPVFVAADVTRLAQAVANLLNNAAKYTARGGHIRLTVEAQAGDAVVSVKDDGIGIPVAMLGRVFDMFTQVDSSLEKTQGGLGMGLTIVKRLVEMHGGTVIARSDGPGAGSEFVIRLRALSTRSAQSHALADAPAPAPDRRRVLVVDDNQDSALALSMMLEIMGHETRTAHDGIGALEVAETFRPRLVLLDIGMPKLNGYDACRRLRAEPWAAGITVVALTGWGQDDDRRRSREAGFDHHLVKPVDPAALKKLLAALR